MSDIYYRRWIALALALILINIKHCILDVRYRYRIYVGTLMSDIRRPISILDIVNDIVPPVSFFIDPIGRGVV